ncbi:MAG: flagellar biosynthesis protein FlhG [Myxococcota bacterium]|jgi:flagellar biosynthesis protein FlhG
MKPIDEQDHYEILEIPPGAGYEDIERAYRLTRAAYSDGSMALYSLFSSNDAEVIRGRIDEAYRVLADPEVRERYDAEEGISAHRSAPQQTTLASDFSTSSAIVGGEFEPETRPHAAELSSAIEVIEDIDADIDEGQQDFDGAALRRARMRRGVELDQISDVTKVSVRFLKCLEAEAFEELPALVYVRGFVTAYARAIGLDTRHVVASYMARVEAARTPIGRQKRLASH